MSASPSAVLALMRLNSGIDVRHVLPSIRTPTLVLHRVGDSRVSVEGGRHLAANIPGAKLVELPGNDHLLWAGERQRRSPSFRARFVESTMSVNMTVARMRSGSMSAREPVRKTSISSAMIAAFGNSDGDLEMLQWTTMSGGVRFGLLVHHTDAEREYPYDRESHFGRLDKALDAAAVNNWTVVDMKRDWKRVFSFQ